MADIIPPTPIDAPFGSYNWMDWYQKVRTSINNAQDLKWSSFSDFTGSNLNQLATRSHQSLQNLQGGTTNEYYHLTAAQQTAIVAGITTVVTTAKLTTGGTNGSMTFTRGILTAVSAAT